MDIVRDFVHFIGHPPVIPARCRSATLVARHGSDATGRARVITSDVRRHGEEHAVHIYEDAMLPGGDGAPMGLGERSSTTRFILSSFNKLYHERFGEEPPALGGLLAWENLRNFQREYHKSRQDGMSVEDIAQVAIRRASFGKHRAALGYDHFELTLGKPDFVDLGPDLGMQKVPVSASAVAHRRNR
jgi:hypothetical protein